MPLRPGFHRNRPVGPRLRGSRGAENQENHSGGHRPCQSDRRVARAGREPYPARVALCQSGQSPDRTGLRHEVSAARGGVRQAPGHGRRGKDGACGVGSQLEKKGESMFAALRRIASIPAAAFGLLLFCQSAWAQSQAAVDLEEVVVTARKRDESLQNVPITLSVFTLQTIQSAGIESPRDFIAMVPNMTLVETQNVGNSFITIRGISQARNSEPSVAVLVDGVLETNPYEFNQELYDIQQIEVLKGPQGALYGRDAIGGAIIIRTADPSDKFEGSTRVGVGNGPAEKVQAAISGPLDADGTLRYRASVNFYDTDGYLQNVYLDRKADPYRDYAARLRLVWKPSDQFSADLRFSYDLTETTAYYFVIPRSDESNPFSDFTTPPNANDTTSPIQNNNLGTDNRDIVDSALKLDFYPGYGTFTSISDYNHTKEIDTG